MYNHINNLPSFKEIEQDLFKELQQIYQCTLVSILEDVDLLLRDDRNFERFKNREMQECTIGTVFGPITIKDVYI